MSNTTTGTTGVPTPPTWITAKHKAVRIGTYLADNPHHFVGRTRAGLAANLGITQDTARQAMIVATAVLATRGTAVLGRERSTGWEYRTSTNVVEFRDSKRSRAKAISTEITRMRDVIVGLDPADPMVQVFNDFLVGLSAVMV